MYYLLKFLWVKTNILVIGQLTDENSTDSESLQCSVAKTPVCEIGKLPFTATEYYSDTKLDTANHSGLSVRPAQFPE